MPRWLKWTLLVLGTAVVSLALFGPYAGLPMAMFIALVSGSLVGSMKLHRLWSGRAATTGGSAVALGLVANGITVGLTMLIFLSCPTGSSGRPMALTFFYFLFALVMTPLVIVRAVQAWPHEKPLAISAIILGLGVLPVSVLTFFALAVAKAFELEP